MGSTAGSYEKAKSLYGEFTKKGNYKGKGFTTYESFIEWKGDKSNAGIYHGSFSKNRNPSARRENGSSWRQTYQDRDYDGTAGEFREEQKILIRYNINNLFDSNFIDNLIKEIEEMQEDMDEYDEDTLRFGANECAKALYEFTPIDTGNLVAQWKVYVDFYYHKIDVENTCEYAAIQNYGSEGTAKGDNKDFIWFPGYFMMEKALHKCQIKMREYARANDSKFKANHNETEL